MIARLLGPPPADRADTRAVGRAGERVAARALRKKSFRILRRNVRSRVGEADLVAVAPDRKTLVVVEVKARVMRSGQGEDRRPEAQITAAKKRKLAAVARTIAAGAGMRGAPLRIDVVAVEFAPGAKALGRNGAGDPVVRHYERAVS